MNYNARTIDELAAQYALGTLRGPARARFEHVCRDDGRALDALHRWEDRLLDLAGAVAPVNPSSAVWRRVQLRLGHSRNARASWRATTQWAMAAGVAALTAALVWWTTFAPAPQIIATIADQQQTQLWRIEARPDRDELLVAALPALPQDAEHAYELWALSPQAGGAPVSLGLMPQTGSRELRLTDAQRAALANATQVAVSLEPVGGSPTGAPTGPVLFVASVAS